MHPVIWVGLALLGYWYVVKGGTTAQLTTTIRNKWTNFCAFNQAGLATGAITKLGGHESFPGAGDGVPLGITSARFAPPDPETGTVATRSGHQQVATGAQKRVRPPVTTATIGGILTRVY
jgi:hypothetical protein